MPLLRSKDQFDEAAENPLALPARTFRRATAADIGLRLRDGAAEDEMRGAFATLRSVDRYLSAFCPDEKCLSCGATLAGMFGSFTWGLTHGEGFCSNCGYPARGYHTIRDEAGKPVLGHAPLILQYHPDALVDCNGHRLSVARLQETFPARR
jgi:hypothetical protein